MRLLKVLSLAQIILELHNVIFIAENRNSLTLIIFQGFNVIFNNYSMLTMDSIPEFYTDNSAYLQVYSVHIGVQCFPTLTDTKPSLTRRMTGRPVMCSLCGRCSDHCSKVGSTSRSNFNQF